MSHPRSLDLLLLCGCLICTSLAADTWVVHEDGVGPVKIGMTVAQLTKIFQQKLIEQDSGSDNCFYIDAPGHDHVGFMIINGHVARIDVTAPGIATSAGIQVGDSEVQVLKLYGARVKATEHAYVDGGHYLTVRSSSGGHAVRFETDGHKVTGYYAGTYDAIQYIEGCE